MSKKQTYPIEKTRAGIENTRAAAEVIYSLLEYHDQAVYEQVFTY
ncbi:MAG: hypothetical protein SFY80_14910 [Verrucomicrobiota bacterium]|nr:hypothetical protein [Verrucomicrobiota bacterium]